MPGKTTSRSRRGYLTEQVVSHIRAMIENGELRKGNRLPPERDLAVSMHISRSSLRTGISFLTAMGVLESRQGVGTYVVEDPPAFQTCSFNVLADLHGFSMDQMYEARIALERSLVGMAAERATSEHLAVLAEEVAGMYAAVGDAQQHLAHDMHFHRTIAVASGNPILAALMETVTAALYERSQSVSISLHSMKSSADNHRKIYKAIRAGSSASAQDSMEMHLQDEFLAQVAGISNETVRGLESWNAQSIV